MIHFLIFLGFLLYSIQAMAVYLPDFKNSSLYIPLGLGTSLLACLIWLYIAKTLHGKDVLFYGVIWDVIILCAYTIVPLLFFGVEISRLGILGLCLVFAGIIILKVGQL